MQQDPYADPTGADSGTSTTGNWWDGPPPPGYTGTWPPPLPQGAKYGQAPGSIDYTGMVPTDPNFGIEGPSGGSYVAPGGGYTGQAPAPAPIDSGGGGTGGGGGTTTTAPNPLPPGTTLLDPFKEQFTPPPQTTIPNAPTWSAPDPNAINLDPSYKWREGQGANALQNWAAAQGTLNDSSTAKSLIDYGQNAASQEYQNIWNRAYTPYQQSVANWQTQAGITQHANDTGYANAYNKWLSDLAIFQDQRDSTFNKTLAYTTA